MDIDMISAHKYRTRTFTPEQFQILHNTVHEALRSMKDIHDKLTPDTLKAFRDSIVAMERLARNLEDMR